MDMTANSALAWTLLIVAGAANATFGLPMKFIRQWEWENTWALWSVLALVLLPAMLAFFCVPSLPGVYRGAGAETLSIVFLLGAGWGVAQVLFGKAMHKIGIGLTFSIVLGLSAAAGSVLPMLRMRSETIGSDALVRIFAGLMLVVLGVSACAEAGRRRERRQINVAAGSESFMTGLIMALCSGALASFMNLGLSFGNPIAAQAVIEGASEGTSVFAIWLPLLLGGAVPNLIYCGYLLRDKKTWALFGSAPRSANICLASAMAILWFFSTALYGVAAQALGEWGGVVGWPVFMSVIVISAGLIGVVTGEWKHSGKSPILFQAAGILLLVIAIVAFSAAHNRVEQPKLQTRTRAAVSRICVSMVEMYVR